MALGKLHITAKAADSAKLLLLNKRQLKETQRTTLPHQTVTIPYPDFNLNVTWYGLPPKNLIVSSVAHVPPFYAG